MSLVPTSGVTLPGLWGVGDQAYPSFVVTFSDPLSCIISRNDYMRQMNDTNCRELVDRQLAIDAVEVLP